MKTLSPSAQFLLTASDTLAVEQIHLPYIDQPVKYEDLLLSINTLRLQRIFLITGDSPPYQDAQSATPKTTFVQYQDPDTAQTLRFIDGSLTFLGYSHRPTPNLYVNIFEQTPKVVHFTHGVWGLPNNLPSLIFITKEALNKNTPYDAERIAFIQNLALISSQKDYEIQILCRASDIDPALAQFFLRIPNIFYRPNTSHGIQIIIENYTEHNRKIKFTRGLFHDFRFEDHMYRVDKDFVSPIRDPRVVASFSKKPMLVSQAPVSTKLVQTVWATVGDLLKRRDLQNQFNMVELEKCIKPLVEFIRMYPLYRPKDLPNESDYSTAPHTLGFRDINQIQDLIQRFPKIDALFQERDANGICHYFDTIYDFVLLYTHILVLHFCNALSLLCNKTPVYDLDKLDWNQFPARNRRAFINKSVIMRTAADGFRVATPLEVYMIMQSCCVDPRTQNENEIENIFENCKVGSPLTDVDWADPLVRQSSKCSVLGFGDPTSQLATYDRIDQTPCTALGFLNATSNHKTLLGFNTSIPNVAHPLNPKMSNLVDETLYYVRHIPSNHKKVKPTLYIDELISDESLIWTVGGEYRVFSYPHWNTDLRARAKAYGQGAPLTVDYMLSKLNEELSRTSFFITRKL